MKIDADISRILQEAACGFHRIDKTIEQYLRSLPGFKNKLHRKGTVSKYEYCLVGIPQKNFLYYYLRSR